MGRHDNSSGAPRRSRRDYGGSNFRSSDGASSSGRPGRRYGSRRDEEDEEEDDGPGWWEVPREMRSENQVPVLEPWQVEKLELAYATGRRKTQIQELGRELGVDRSIIINWFKEFKARPKSEVNAIVSQRKAEAAAAAEAQRVRDAQLAAAEAATGLVGGKQEARPPGAPETGFVPFYLRKQLGLDKNKRISGEALRTLESIYDRTPFPSADVVKGLYDLHRLQRDVVVQWFAARREADGIQSSTQKRGRMSDRQRDRATLNDAFKSDPDADDDDGFGGNDLALGRSSSGASSRGHGSSSSEVALDNLVEGLAGKAGKAQQARNAKPVVVTMSKRDMAMLRSSLPSPRKHTGKKLAEELDIKTGAGSNMTQIGNLQFVLDEVSQEEKMRQAWRYRQGGAGGAATGQRLRLASNKGSSSSSRNSKRNSASDGDDNDVGPSE